MDKRIIAALLGTAALAVPTAADEGDVTALEELLAEDAVLYSDGGGKASPARKPLFGAARIARAMVVRLRHSRPRRPDDHSEPSPLGSSASA
jgi:hypothetical protein